MKNSETLTVIIDIVAKASCEILKIFDAVNSGCVGEGALNLSFKDDSTPLTVADELANSILVDGLTTNFSLPVLTEEAKSVSYDRRSQWRAYWCIDPLDGTKEFIAGIDEFTVNVALVIDGRAVLGIVACPVSGEVFFGISIESDDELRAVSELLGGSELTCAAPFFQTLKSALSDGDAEGTGRNWTPVRVAKVATPLRLLTSRHHHGKSTQAILSSVGHWEEVAMGSSLKMCRIAEGAADLYIRFGPTSEWDTAAAQAVLEGAGGQLLDLSGRPLQYNQKDSVINPPFFASGQGVGVSKGGQIVLKEGEFNADDHQ